MAWGEKVPEETTCHGCGGRGWVPVNGNAVVCPVCNGAGKIRGRKPNPKRWVMWGSPRSYDTFHPDRALTVWK